MLNADTFVESLSAAVTGCSSRTTAAHTIRSKLIELQATLSAPRPDGGQAMLRLHAMPPPYAGESLEQTAARLNIRMDEVELARRFGDQADVSRMINLAVAEVRDAVLSRVKTNGTM